ncbi:MAG: hypothetical protein IT385_25055 [Deltaproteobacteria bacterium]|nr:hypothetical protein [Deltaproteobacteria bacterium]
METRRDLLLAIFVVTAACLTLSFVSVGLFARMSPAADEVGVEARLEAIEGTQAMLGVFAARWGEGVDQAGVARLEAALAQMRARVEGDERGEMLIARLTDATGRAMFGERAPLGELAEAAGSVVHDHTDGLRAIVQRTARLGSAGAWAAALGGLVVTVLAFLAFARLERRVVRPARELSRVLAAARSGDLFQRCRPLDGTTELEQALVTVNVLLDRQAVHAALPGREAPRDDQRPADELGRRALARLLDREPGAVVIVALPGGIVAANGVALERLAIDEGLRDRIARAVSEGGDPTIGVETLEADRLALCRLA